MMARLKVYKTWKLPAFTAVILPTLIACTGEKDVLLQQWMAEQKGNTPVKIVPIAAPKKFVPQVYTQQGSIEPFNNQKLLQALRKDSPQSTANLALISPELTRRKEALENYPLDSVSMVGVLDKKNTLVALLKINSFLHQVKVGNYVGQNYGRITKITDTDISIREIVQDAAGEWIERKVNLQLQAQAK